MRVLGILLAVLLPASAVAETLVAARTIRARTPITMGDLAITQERHSGALARAEDAVGQEARMTIYQGRPIRREDLEPAAVVERNDLVLLIYSDGVLQIRAEGRALGRGAVGDRLRIMNLASRVTITGTVLSRGEVSVP